MANEYAIITGARRGIGRETVGIFAEKGINIYACARKRDSLFEKDMSDIAKREGVSIMPCYFELSDRNQIKQGIRQIIANKTPIDYLINCAGIADSGILTMTSIDRLKEVFQINYFAQIEIMQIVARVMIRQHKGSIVNVSSIAGIEANEGYLSYGSSKAALIWATRSISKELGKYGIRVNAVAPGMTKTDMGGVYKSKEELDSVITNTALRRMGFPNEIAEAIFFLASSKASFVSGEILQVDGGRI